jgi:TonB family protein
MNGHDPGAPMPAPGFSRKWIDRVAQRLLKRAARRAPPFLAERLEEEWLADLAARRTSVARLRLAIGCCRAASVIAHEHGTPNVTAATARGAKAVAAYAPPDPTFFSRRSAAVIAILALHALIVYLLTVGIVHRMGAAPPPVINTRFIDEVHPSAPPPPLAGPQLGRHTIEAGPDTITVPEKQNSPPSRAPASIIVQRVLGGPGTGFPNTADYYPAAAIRLREQGGVAVQVCIAGSGRLTSDPAIVQSSGSPRLDAGALALAKAGSGHYRPTTEDGRPVSSCFPLRIRFELRN